jgi:hypothetical protein
MKLETQITVILATVLMIGVCNVQAAIDWDFYEDGTIDPCDEYANVRVFDTPPDHTTVDMTGGSAYNILTYDFSTLNVTGGVTEIGAFDESTINIGGGTIYGLGALNSSNVNVFGGSVYSLSAHDTGIVNVWDDADVDALSALESGVVNMWDGQADHVGAGEFGTVNLSGGLVTDYLGASGSGVINIYGYDLEKFASGGKYGDGFVSGVWQDDVAFNFDFYGSGTYSRVALIPEPSTLAIVMAGVLLLRKRGR